MKDNYLWIIEIAKNKEKTEKEEEKRVPFVSLVALQKSRTK